MGQNALQNEVKPICCDASSRSSRLDEKKASLKIILPSVLSLLRFIKLNFVIRVLFSVGFGLGLVNFAIIHGSYFSLLNDNLKQVRIYT